MISFKELETERLILKKFNYEDYLKVWKYDYRYYFGIPELSFRDKENPSEFFDDVKKYGNNNDNFYEKDYLKNFKEMRWIVCLKSTNEAIGTIMTNYEKNFNDCSNFGYMFLKEYWGHGYAYESANKVLEYLYDCGIETINACANNTNIKSNRLLKKLGFIYIGIEDEVWTMFNGKSANIKVKNCLYIKENPKIKIHQHF